jgi:hypothetical protein
MTNSRREPVMRLGYQALIGVIVIASSGSVFRLQFDDGASRFRFVRRQTGEIFVAPIRKIYDSRSLNSSARSLLGRLQNVQPIAIQQKCVISKQLVQLRNCRMTVGNGLDFELVDGSRDLFGSQFHRSVLSIGFFVP